LSKLLLAFLLSSLLVWDFELYVLMRQNWYFCLVHCYCLAKTTLLYKKPCKGISYANDVTTIRIPLTLKKLILTICHNSHHSMNGSNFSGLVLDEELKMADVLLGSCANKDYFFPCISVSVDEWSSFSQNNSFISNFSFLTYCG
jgi:hypothetical protein